MKRRLMWPWLLIAVGIACGQQSSSADPGFITLRLSRADFGSLHFGIFEDCLLINSSGTVHRERRIQDLQGSSQARVFEGKLDAASLSELTAILEDPEFRTLNLRPAASLQILNGTMRTVVVVREQGVQGIYAGDEKQLRPFNRQLKPLMTWWRKVEKLKLTETKAVPATGCDLGISPQYR